METAKLESHKRTLGIIYIFSGTFTILGALAINMILSLIFSFAFNEANPEEKQILDFITSLLSILPTILIVVVAIPTLIAAYGLLSKQSWGVIFSLIVGCLKLFSFPIGTAIGVYAIWIFSEDQRTKKETANG